MSMLPQIMVLLIFSIAVGVLSLLLKIDDLAYFLFGIQTQGFWTFAQAAIVGFSLLLIYTQIRSQKHANMISILDTLNKNWHSKDILRARICVCHQFREARIEIEDRDVLVLLFFFEELGLWVNRGLVDVQYAWTMFDERVQKYWQILSPLIIRYREDENDVTFYEEFEKLRTILKDYSIKRGIAVPDLDHEQILKFARSQEDVLIKWLSEHDETLNKPNKHSRKQRRRLRI